MADSDDDMEILNLSELRRSRTYIDQMLGDVTKQSAAKQVVIGGAAGWYENHSFCKQQFDPAYLFLLIEVMIMQHDLSRNSNVR